MSPKSPTEMAVEAHTMAIRAEASLKAHLDECNRRWDMFTESADRRDSDIRDRLGDVNGKIAQVQKVLIGSAGMVIVALATIVWALLQIKENL